MGISSKGLQVHCRDVSSMLQCKIVHALFSYCENVKKTHEVLFVSLLLSFIFLTPE